MWSKYVTRRLAVQVAQAWNFGWGEAMQKVYGVSIENTLVIRDEQKTDYYVDKEEHERYISGLYKLLKKPSFLKTFHYNAREALESILEATSKEFAMDFKDLSNKELLELYRNFVLPNQTQFYIRMWTVFNIGEPLAHAMEEQIRRYETDDNKISEYLLIFSTPLEPNDVLNERKELLRIAQALPRLSSEELLQELEAHTLAFQHIPMFDFDHEPYTIEHFEESLSAIENPGGELASLDEQFVDHEREYAKALETLSPDEEFKTLAQFMKENVFLRDYRDMIRQKLNLELRKFYGAIGTRLGFSVEETATLTNDEIIDCLAQEVSFPKNEIEKRHTAYLLIQNGSDAKIFSGSAAVDRAKQELGDAVTSAPIASKEILGVIGSRGKATGKAKIVFTNKDLGKVEKGDILIASMTRQDFVPAMRKASAIVTDEGSVTAHAAIIARELGIPCIVAAKNATTSFKDGDLIEVDATCGIVRILDN